MKVKGVTAVLLSHCVVGPDHSETMSKTGEKRVSKTMYRTSWEKNPMLRDWIQSVPGKPDKAYCRFCQRMLYAHRYSVLKHTCTIKHQQNSDKFKGRTPKGLLPAVAEVKLASAVSDVKTTTSNVPGDQPELIDNATDRTDTNDDEANVAIELEMRTETSKRFITFTSLVDDSSQDIGKEYLKEEEDYIIEEDDGSTQCEEYDFVEAVEVSSPASPAEIDSMSTHKYLTISTHILDTSRGKAATDVPVTLFKMENNIWKQISQSVTNADGRVPSLVPNDEFSTGLYKLHFDTNEYFKQTTSRFLYPFVEIVFNCDDISHYHIPLLLNPFGYSTYRGT